MANLFFSYSHEDEELRDQLEKQLSMLKRESVIEAWHDRRIDPGADWAESIDQHVETDDIILLLVSPDFLASDYCYEKEMTRAMERHASGEAIVIPVILRACDWQHAPFGKLQAVPKDGKPVTLMPNLDAALLLVARAVRTAAETISKSAAPASPRSEPTPDILAQPKDAQIRSSNLRLAKDFTERDKDVFRTEAFEYTSRYFEGSLQALEERNPGLQTSFRRVDLNRFTAAIYQNGKSQAKCTIFLGGDFGMGGIAYVYGETSGSNTFNEQLTVHSDDQKLYLRPLGMAHQGGERDATLTFEGGAEFFWSIFIAPLQ